VSVARHYESVISFGISTFEQIESRERPGELAAGVAFRRYLEIAHRYLEAAVFWRGGCGRNGRAPAREDREASRA